ncbi:MAG: hypothetical protein WC554_05080 [Clostridia bacterium]|jgi:hypothetical protein
MAKTIVELLNDDNYDASVVGLYTKMWMLGDVFVVNSKKTRGGSYTVKEYEGKDEAEAIRAFEESENRR